MENKHVNLWTKKELLSLPWRDGDTEDWGREMEFDSLIIIPGLKRHMHDSGYRCMDFIGVRDLRPVCRLSGCSDVIHIEGVGGYGETPFPSKFRTGLGRAVPWSIDCLERSGLLHIFASGHTVICGAALSSFDLYSKVRPQKKED